LKSLAVSLTHVRPSGANRALHAQHRDERIQLNRFAESLRWVFVSWQLSDIHHGPFSSPEQIERAVETANRLQPDIIALTGDYISKERHYAAPCAEMMGRLKAKYGVYAVLETTITGVDAPLLTDLFRAEGNHGPDQRGYAFRKGWCGILARGLWTTRWSDSKISPLRWPVLAKTR
jgi:hypothetical protein